LTGDSDWMGRAGAPADRRKARGHHTRGQIVDAAIELIQGGNPAPTVAEITRRARVSVRVLHNHFPHVEVVIRNAAAQQFHRHRQFIAFLPPNGPVDFRIRATCHQRRQLYEAMAPMLRVAYARATQSDGFNHVLVENRSLLRQQMARTLGPEISARGPDGPRLLDMLLLTSGWLTWDTLRSQGGYSAVAAERFMVRALADLLG